MGWQDGIGRRHVVAAWLAAAALGVAPAASAQGAAAGDEVDDAARVLFERGVEAYRAGDYERALERFQQAHTITGDPELLFNIGTTLDRLRRDAEAIEAFERYLEARPDAANRPAVERRLEDLRENAGVARPAPSPVAAPVEPEPGDDAPPDARGGLHPAFFWTGVGLTAVAGGVLAWSAVNTTQRNDDYEMAVADARVQGGTREDVQPLLDDAQAAERRTNVLIGVTAGLAATTVVLAIFTGFGGSGDDGADDGAPSAAAVMPTLAIGPGGGGVGLVGRF